MLDYQLSKHSRKRTTKKEPTKSLAKDSCQTPAYALDPLVPYLTPGALVWESACGEGNLVRGLEARGFRVIGTDILDGPHHNFFGYEPESYDYQVTNPPYSIKLEWVARCYQLGKPFALLLPVEVLGVGQSQRMFREWGIEVILLSRRVDYRTLNTDFPKSSVPFPSAWYTWGLGIGQQLTFADLNKKAKL